MTGSVWCSTLALATVCLVSVAAEADAQSMSRGYSTTESGSYLNLGPRQRMTQPPLVQAPRRAPSEATEAAGARRTVVCGMTMLSGDNAIDQKMVLTVPEGVKGGAARPFTLPMCADRPAPDKQ